MLKPYDHQYLLDNWCQFNVDDLVIQSEMDSTNQFCQRYHDDHRVQTAVVLADRQTQGRGRSGKTWVSPPGCNIYCSIYRYLNTSIANLPPMSLVVGMALCDSFRALGFSDVMVKWPNDIWIKGKKCAGILVECATDSDGVHVTVGFGINVNMDNELGSDIDQPWTSLSHTLSSVNRDAILVDVVSRVFKSLDEYEKSGFAPYYQEGVIARLLTL